MESAVRDELARAKQLIKDRLAKASHSNTQTTNQTNQAVNQTSNQRTMIHVVHDCNGHIRSDLTPTLAIDQADIAPVSGSPPNEITEPIRKRARVDATPVSHHHQSSLLDVPPSRLSHQFSHEQTRNQSFSHPRRHINEATQFEIDALYQSIIDSRDQLGNEHCEFDSDDDFVSQLYSQSISQSISPAVCHVPHSTPIPLTPLVIGQSRETSDSNSDINHQQSAQLTDHNIASSVHLALPPSSAPPSAYNPFIQGCRSVFNNYTRLGLIDEGTYGVVYKALDKETNNIVALKRLKLDDPQADFPITIIREINLLLTLPKHPNIVHCKEVVTGREASAVYLVMEYAEFDLKHLFQTFKQPRPFTLNHVKLLVHQLLSGLSFLHSHSVVHRDIKMANLLYTNTGCLKLCDFGLARRIGCVDQQLTALVVTLWFRSPELLMGADEYDQSIDIWSAGCVMAEFIRHEPLFPGTGEMDQLSRIFSALGSPTISDWPDVVNTSHWQSWSIKPSPNRLNELFPRPVSNNDLALSGAGFDLLSSILRYDPSKRITAAQALQHQWFTEEPRMASLNEMPKFAQPKKGR